MPAISFILPVYNMETYLPRVIQSLKRQTLTDFEAIFVNDGSRDSSHSICAQAAEEDSRFHLIDQLNGGVASARNAALDAASGEYIFFLDPDDWIESTTVEILVQLIKKEHPDMIQFGMFNDIYDESNHLQHSSIIKPALSGVYRGEPFKEFFNELGSCYLIIGKLFCREFLEKYHLRFAHRQLGEDGLFYVDFYHHNPHCVVSFEKALYHYTLFRKTSLSNSYHPERLDDNFYLSDAVWSVISDWGLLESPMHLQKARYCTVRDLQMGVKNLALSPLSLAAQVEWLRCAIKTPRVQQSVQKTPLRIILNRNDKIKLFLLKMHLYRITVLISKANQIRN